jgi:hypothetical protein
MAPPDGPAWGAVVANAMTQPRYFDVFNGDADGLCALHQLRLVTPRASGLITGVKRDVNLLGRVVAQEGDSVTALDISLDVNRAALLHLLANGVNIEYFDHHFAGDIPQHPCLRAFIDTSPTVCTSLIVDRHLAGRHRLWAIVAAFGDNLGREARMLAKALGLVDEQIDQLRELGESLNYNAYGESEDDLFVRPAALFVILHHYADPFAFLGSEPVVREIGEGRRRDMEMARQLQPEIVLPSGSIYFLPDAPWSRRVRGVFGNGLVASAPDLAHAILSPNAQGGYTVSVRARLAASHGADRLCREFPTGSGRSAAAGINHLPQAQLPEFVRAFERIFGTEVK